MGESVINKLPSNEAVNDQQQKKIAAAGGEQQQKEAVISNEQKVAAIDKPVVEDAKIGSGEADGNLAAVKEKPQDSQLPKAASKENLAAGVNKTAGNATAGDKKDDSPDKTDDKKTLDAETLLKELAEQKKNQERVLNEQKKILSELKQVISYCQFDYIFKGGLSGLLLCFLF